MAFANSSSFKAVMLSAYPKLVQMRWDKPESEQLNIDATNQICSSASALLLLSLRSIVPVMNCFEIFAVSIGNHRYVYQIA